MNGNRKSYGMEIKNLTEWKLKISLNGIAESY